MSITLEKFPTLVFPVNYAGIIPLIRGITMQFGRDCHRKNSNLVHPHTKNHKVRARGLTLIISYVINAPVKQASLRV